MPARSIDPPRGWMDDEVTTLNDYDERWLEEADMWDDEEDDE